MAVVEGPRVLVVTDKSDLAETHLIIGLHQAGVDIQVACNPAGRHYTLLKNEGIVSADLSLSGRFDRQGSSTIRRLVECHGIEVVHCFNPRALACSLRATRGFRVKVIAYRGVIGNVSYLNPESWITFLHPRLDRIVCVSDAVKRYFLGIRLLGKKIAEHKVVRIYKGHKLSWYEAPPADLSPFGFPEGAFVVCCIGRDRPGKGFSTLIKSLDHMPADSRVYLLLVGQLEENEALLRQVRESPLAGRVRFAGFRHDAPQVAAACHALVLPSESEGLPRVVIEAMAYSKPVVVTDAGGMPELVRDGVEGLVVPVRDSRALADALVRLEVNRESAKEMGQRGRQRIAASFNAADTVRETADLYRELASESAR